MFPHVSPDGQRVAVTVQQNDSRNIWVYDLRRRALTRVTFQGEDADPVWSPDGRDIYFSSRIGNSGRLVMRAASDGSSAMAEKITEGARPTGISPDGKLLALIAGKGWGIATFDLEKRESTPYPANTNASASWAVFSPNGRELAYTSDESGRWEVYVQSFAGSAGAGKKIQVSTEGGKEPVWSQTGNELFYWNDGVMMAARLNRSAGIEATPPYMLFKAPPHNVTTHTPLPYQSYDAAPDGQSFVMIEDMDSRFSQIAVVLNWLETMKRVEAAP
jgi:Tol biopolymer transport system component